MGPAIKVAHALQKRREEGALSGRNVTPIMEMVLGMWAGLESGTKEKEALSRAEFLASVSA
jgi:hypothetical protein